MAYCAPWPIIMPPAEFSQPTAGSDPALACGAFIPCIRPHSTTYFPFLLHWNTSSIPHWFQSYFKVPRTQNQSCVKPTQKLFKRRHKVVHFHQPYLPTPNFQRHEITNLIIKILALKSSAGRFGTKRPRVQIPPLRPKNGRKS